MDAGPDLVVTEPDCGTNEGLWMTPVVEEGDIKETAARPGAGSDGGRTSFSRGDDIAIPAGTLLDEQGVAILTNSASIAFGYARPSARRTATGVRHLLRPRPGARSPRQQRRGGGCDRCPIHWRTRHQLTMRTFHIGGAASRDHGVSNSVQIKSRGTLHGCIR